MLSTREPCRDARVAVLGDLFNDLVQAHERLIAALTDLARATCDPVPNRARYTLARLRLSQASRVRRAVLKDAIDLVRASAGPADAEALRQLQSGSSEMLLESSAHVTKWTIGEVERNWATYCAASGLMRLRMMARIDAEKRIVYPLLKQRALR